MADDLAAALAEIREREQNTVPGPWEVRESGTLWELLLGNDRYHRALLRAAKTGDWPGAGIWPGTANGQFIAHARMDVPRLLAAVDAVLKLAVELTGDAAPSSAYEEDRSWLRAEIGARFRSAVLAALTGERRADG